jgi:peptidoglycan/LPS O-acetylase OafA/YrhL
MNRRDTEGAEIKAGGVYNFSGIVVDPLLSLRGLACLMVVIGHCVPPKATIFWHNYDLTWLIFSAGGVAVRMFFCLSGYLIGKAFYNQRYHTNLTGLSNFWRNRALRILPLFYFAFFSLSLIFYQHIWQPENREHLIGILTFTFDYSLPLDFHGALWYISTELQFYLVIPFIYLYLRDRLTNLKQIVVVFFSLIVLLFCLRLLIWSIITTHVSIADQQFRNFAKYIYMPLVTNLDSFIGGFLVNPFIIIQKSKPQINQRLKSLISLPNLGFLLIFSLYLFTAYYKYHHQFRILFVGPTITALLTPVFLYLVEFNSYPKSIHLTYNSFKQLPLIILGYFGYFSYGIYIWHFPIVTKMIPIIFSSNDPLTAFIFRFLETITLSTLLSIVTYYLIELPAIKFKRQIKVTS